MTADEPLDPDLDTQRQDEVVDKIDQLLNRHRPKSVPPEAIPVLTPEAPAADPAVADDGIPVLTDAVSASRAPPPKAPAQKPAAINTTLVLRRLALALEAEHARLRAQIGGDAFQLRLLDRLIAELRRALPNAIRAALPEQATADDGLESTRPGEDRRL